MNERLMQFRIGMFVIVAGLVLTMMIVWFGESPAILRDQVYLKVRYAERPACSRAFPSARAASGSARSSRSRSTSAPTSPTVCIVTLAIERQIQAARGHSPAAGRDRLIGDVTIDMQPGTGPAISQDRQVAGRSPDHRRRGRA